MLYEIAVFVHVLAAVTWVGGALFLAMVTVPVVRREIESPAQASRLLSRMGRQFRPVSWAAVALLVVTGLFIATDHWRVTAGDLFADGGWFINVLRAKMGLVAMTIALSVVHDFVLGPRLTAGLERLSGRGGPPADLVRARRALVWLARANILVVLAVIALGVTLTRGSPF